MATISILYGSVRTARQGIRAARFIQTKIQERGHKVHFLDPMDENLPFLDKMYKEYAVGEAPKVMESIAQKLKASDGFVIVSAEYNHSIPAALKNMLDHFQKEYHFKPSAILSYSAGSFGGVRAAMHLRSILAELGMSSIPSVLPVPMVQKAFDENGIAIDEAYHQRAKRFLDEFDWYVEALAERRAKGTP